MFGKCIVNLVLCSVCFNVNILFFVIVKGIGLLLVMLHLLCSSSLNIFGMALEPCSEIFLPILTQIWMLK